MNSLSEICLTKNPEDALTETIKLEMQWKMIDGKKYFCKILILRELYIRLKC